MLEIKSAYTGQPGVTDTMIYTCPDNTQARVLKCTATNDTTTAVTLSFNKVKSGGVVGDDNLVMNERVIGSKETYECPELVGQVLEGGDLISAIAGVADQVTVALSVVETT